MIACVLMGIVPLVMIGMVSLLLIVILSLLKFLCLPVDELFELLPRVRHAGLGKRASLHLRGSRHN
jgi:hypothetical protein